MLKEKVIASIPNHIILCESSPVTAAPFLLHFSRAIYNFNIAVLLPLQQLIHFICPLGVV